MAWKLSQFRAGDLVEVRSKEEILATLDAQGCVDGMPFMPEMLRYCGARARVSAVAHKACDTARGTWKNRRVQAAVHLAGLRCDGSAHGGCEAECNLFWKDVWLKPASDAGREAPARAVNSTRSEGGCTEAQLQANTRVALPVLEDEPRYSCQATRMFDATEAISPWDPRPYFYDVVTGNHSVGRMTRVVFLGWLRWLLYRIPVGYRPFKWFHDRMHWWLLGRAAPSISPKVKEGSQTPTGRLDLKPGEYVRVKSQQEIELTLDQKKKNRGLGFDPEEMAPYCGRVFQVRKAVTKIIDEPTGRMIPMKQPCIMLEGVYCQGECATGRLGCPREIPPYWRELWLERVDVPQRSTAEAPVAADAPACSGVPGPGPGRSGSAGEKVIAIGLLQRDQNPSCEGESLPGPPACHVGSP
jgi:hypothetical protein